MALYFLSKFCNTLFMKGAKYTKVAKFGYVKC